MSRSAYVKLVEKSKQQAITLEEVEKLIEYYQEITTKTGDQLSWEYGAAAFPYKVEYHEKDSQKFYLLKGIEADYQYIIVGLSNARGKDNDEQIQIVLPEGSTHGDKGKANEFCKFLAKQLSGELHLFNGRIMYYYKR
ncbi:DUF1885 family protein [Pseudalkalibacillus berkeleyi]|uniref:DUF1885 family protein n=1 Tax=Pseudalkalibacillus berkeleyi TaxID=1069813 RepID=A0ABS9GVV5_9BACL|nr:DUF1885 family protein [Pseudalkalibacillus berkeleyi]MCF6136947.1 DUF1885 family protein [Pseudalkalibacillus berkeleyi]